MKLLDVTILALLLGMVSAPPSATANKKPATPVGYWKTFDRESKKPNSIVRVYQSDGELRGRIEKLINPPEKDPICDKCPGNKKNKPILGLEFLWGFKRDGDGWSEGKVLDPEEGKIYNATIELIESGKRLKLFGYTRIVVKIGETEIWERVAPEEWGIAAK